MSIIKLKNVSKFYYNKSTISSGFNKLNLELDMGEFVVITGESGSGKSTLLNVISGLDSYEEGEMYINGEETSHYTEVDYELYRRKYIGNIFQHFNLVNSYTVYQNIELVLLFNGYKKDEVKDKILSIIDTVGLTKYKNTVAAKLSGGQKQRVAIARALAKDTPIIVADEPTGNLDVKSAKAIMELLHKISKDKLVVIVTHNYEQVEEYATRKISMHDGKIIEDKKLKPYDKVEAKEVEYKDITPLNQIRLGLRNVFNIKMKFLLLFLVYFFLTAVVFSEYTSLRMVNYNQDSYGYNNYFRNQSANRVILNKKDRTSFSSSELNTIKNLKNIESLEEDDVFLDNYYDLYNDNFYLNGTIAPIEEITSVDVGSMPTSSNEIVIAGPEDSYYISSFNKDLIGKELTLRTGSTQERVKIVGIKYENIDDSGSIIVIDEFKFYLHKDIIKAFRKGTNATVSSIEIKMGNNVFEQENGINYYTVSPNDKVKDGTVYLTNDFIAYCDNFDCTNNKVKVSIENIYYKDNIDLVVKATTNKDNFKSLTGLSNYEENSYVVYMSENDYDRLFVKDTYQISVFLKDGKISDETLTELDKLGYNTIYMRDILTNPMKDFMGVINILRSIVFIVAAIALFFISYFIIKIILKSRNIYYSTIRILGATKKQATNLLNIELLADINIAYFAFIILVILVKNGVVNIDYIKEMVTFFKLFDYIIVYIILSIMSFLLSNRYAHRLFKDSVMSTYREEV